MTRLTVVTALLVYAANAQQAPFNDPATLVDASVQQRAAWAAGWLKSDDPRHIAWGAWLAKVDRQTALSPLLLRKITEPGLDDGAMLWVLDALIELRAQVPVEDAHRLYPQYAAQSIVLLIRSGTDGQAALLDIFDHATVNAEWLAAGNALLNIRTQGFVARLLDKFTQHLTIAVFDPHSAIGAGSGGSIGCGMAPEPPKVGWPPIARYRLTQQPFPGAVLLVSGPTPVYYTLGDPGCDDGDRDRYRAQYLTRLLPYSLSKSLEAYPDERLEWQGAADYPGQLESVIDQRRKLFMDAMEQLVKYSGLLTSEKAALLKPQIEVVVQDRRSDRSVPLTVTPEVKTAFSKPLL